MVALFFVISGYALSWAPLKSENSEAMLRRLSSGIFRRAARLFMPGVVSTFLVMVCIRLGLYTRGYASINSDDMPGFQEPGPPLLLADPFSVQLNDWIRATWHYVNIWNMTGHSYDVHLWTLPVEFRCSIALFMTMVALSRAAPIVRLFGLATMVLYCHFADSWEGWLFFAGAFLAQLRLLQMESENDAIGDQVLPTDEDDVLSEKRAGKRESGPWSMDSLRYVLFFGGLYLLSTPDYGHGKPSLNLRSPVTYR
jgi:peptidoglycan/LPS O-acetylase OafA/YrhL